MLSHTFVSDDLSLTITYEGDQVVIAAVADDAWSTLAIQLSKKELTDIIKLFKTIKSVA